MFTERIPSESWQQHDGECGLSIKALEVKLRHLQNPMWSPSSHVADRAFWGSSKQAPNLTTHIDCMLIKRMNDFP